MEIQIDPHTRARAAERGASEEEIREVINAGFSVPGNMVSWGNARFMLFSRRHMGDLYEHRRVEVFYTLERGIIIAVTAYVFYGRWK